MSELAGWNWPELEVGAPPGAAGAPLPTGPGAGPGVAEAVPPAAALWPGAPPDSLDAARAEAAALLDRAAAAAEALYAEARRQGWEEGRREGLAAAQAERDRARAEAEALRAAAQEEAEALRAAAREEAEAIRAAARAEAEVILAGARAEAEAMRATLAARAAELEAQAREALDRELAALAQAAADLALAVARQIVAAELQACPERVVDRVTRGLAELRGFPARVYAHPDDLPLLGAAAPRLEAAAAAPVTLAADAALDRGDYRIESPAGAVDGRVAAQIEHLAAAAGLR